MGGFDICDCFGSDWDVLKQLRINIITLLRSLRIYIMTTEVSEYAMMLVIVLE